MGRKGAKGKAIPRAPMGVSNCIGGGGVRKAGGPEMALGVCERENEGWISVSGPHRRLSAALFIVVRGNGRLVEQTTTR